MVVYLNPIISQAGGPDNIVANILTIILHFVRFLSRGAAAAPPLGSTLDKGRKKCSRLSSFVSRLPPQGGHARYKSRPQGRQRAPLRGGNQAFSPAFLAGAVSTGGMRRCGSSLSPFVVFVKGGGAPPPLGSTLDKGGNKAI